MREDLTNVGFVELKNAEQVPSLLDKRGSALIMINSVCGCAAGNARPAVKLAATFDKDQKFLQLCLLVGMQLQKLLVFQMLQLIATGPAFQRASHASLAY